MKLALLCFFVASSSFLSGLQAQPNMEQLLAQREVLEFSVHYGFLTLGWVKIDAVVDTLYKGEVAHTFRTIIRSNASIPFVGNKERHFHSVFQARGDSLFGLNFWTHDVAKGDFYDSRYVYDYEAEKVFIYQNEEPLDTLALTRAADSGPLLFFLTRLYAGLDERIDFPIYISEEEGSVQMDFTSRKERINVPAFGSVDAYFSSGNASVDGPFGFSGFYRAWHKADGLRVPLEAHVRVWVGNVRVRLISFERYD
ncbi:MAG: DUF3108 domain-containing protein [Bacteroidetes bacterium]|nr:DUF3108 domain-containing protein [Bacteroidota bacterium]MCH8523271.1 hypothetical protein [Balneolales bacterium]